MKKLALILSTVIFTVLGYAEVASAQLTVPQGGTGTTTFVGGYVVTGSSALRLTASPTTTVSCTGTVSCSPFITLGASPFTITGTGGGSDPFTHTTYNAQSVSASSTGLWLTGSPLSLIASSTVLTYASTTALTINNLLWVTGFTAGSPYFDSNGRLFNHATTSSSAAYQDVWRDASQNAFAQNFVSAATTFPSLGTTATLTAASPRTWVVTGTNVQTFKLPVGTTLSNGATYVFNNNSTGLVTIIDNGSNVLTYVLPGGSRTVVLYDNSTTNGSWDSHGYMGHTVYSGNNGISIASTSPFAMLTVHANPTDATPYTTLFAIASSTSNSTTTLWSISNTGTTTAANGIVLTGGCFYVNGACLTTGGSGTVGSGTTGQFPYYAANGTTLTATSSLFLATNQNIGIGSTTPWAKLSIHAFAGETNTSLFAVASSTASATSTLFSITNTGVVTIGPGGTGDALTTVGETNQEWSYGFKTSDKSFRISSSTSLGTNDAIVITKNLNTVLTSASTTNGFTIGGTFWTPLTGVLVGNGASAVSAGSTQTCTNQFVRAMSSLYVATCATVSLTADVTGTLPVSNGGTGAATFTSGQLLYGSGTNPFASVATSTGGTGSTILFVDSAARISPTYASSTAISFTSSLIGTRAGFTGALSPIRNLTLLTATTTTWTASTTNSAYVPTTVAPFTGTLQDIVCYATSTGAFIGTSIFINATPVTPTYFVASSTKGTVTFTANNTFTRGDIIGMNNGTTTTDSNAKQVSCTLRVTETP